MTPTPASIMTSFRTQHGLTLRDAAELLGVSFQAVCLIENGTNTPSDDRIDSWISSEDERVAQLGRAMFMAMHGSTLKAIMEKTS
jgi:transcriptional regulator with XRE-family HTH domain